VYVVPECSHDRAVARLEGVGRNLRSIHNPAAKIVNEDRSIVLSPATDKIADNELRIGV
jgi:hypothetical protein